jgi:hypothetical protein
VTVVLAFFPLEFDLYLLPFFSLTSLSDVFEKVKAVFCFEVLLKHLYKKHPDSLSSAAALAFFSLDYDSYLIPFFVLLLHILTLAVEVVHMLHRQNKNAGEILGVGDDYGIWILLGVWN